MVSVRLDPLRAADADEIIAANIASADHHGAFVTPCRDADGFDAWFKVASQEANRSYVARRIDDGAPVGVINVTQIARGNFLSAYLGYYGYAATSGQGLMTEALRLALAHVFGPLGLHRLEANIQPDNARSIALVSRIGFRKEGFSPRYLNIGGEWRDHERWAITAEDFSH